MSLRFGRVEANESGIVVRYFEDHPLDAGILVRTLPHVVAPLDVHGGKTNLKRRPSERGISLRGVSAGQEFLVLLTSREKSSHAASKMGGDHRGNAPDRCAKNSTLLNGDGQEIPASSHIFDPRLKAVTNCLGDA